MTDYFRLSSPPPPPWTGVRFFLFIFPSRQVLASPLCKTKSQMAFVHRFLVFPDPRPGLLPNITGTLLIQLILWIRRLLTLPFFPYIKAGLLNPIRTILFAPTATRNVSPLLPSASVRPAILALYSFFFSPFVPCGRGMSFPHSSVSLARPLPPPLLSLETKLFSDFTSHLIADANFLSPVCKSSMAFAQRAVDNLDIELRFTHS